MASMHKEISINAAPEAIWDAVRDVGALHTRLVPGFVTDCKVEGEERVVTFGNGAVMRESIVSIDDSRKRLCWAIFDAKFAKHYNAVMTVTADGDKARVSWDSDFLPRELGERISPMQDLGLATIKKTFEQSR